jgi:hypothetical protein
MRRLFILLAVAFMLAATIRVDALLAIPASQDTDGDGLPDVQEDTNGNGILDTGETNPYNVDTDGGGESNASNVIFLTGVPILANVCSTIARAWP